MIRMGRPYTNENGAVDGALITERNDEAIAVVGGWIRQNIRKRKKILPERTSYGMRHEKPGKERAPQTHTDLWSAERIYPDRMTSPKFRDRRQRVVTTPRGRHTRK